MQNKLYTGNKIRHGITKSTFSLISLTLCYDKEHILQTSKAMHVQFEVSVPNTYLGMTTYFFSFNSLLPKLSFFNL